MLGKFMHVTKGSLAAQPRFQFAMSRVPEYQATEAIATMVRSPR